MRPGGRGAQRIDQRAHFSRESTGAPGLASGRDGRFGAQVVAVDATSGAVVGATIGEWSCTAPGPVQFDGAYEIDGLAVGHSYTVYAEALNGAVDPSQFVNAIVSLCRNTVSDPGCPPLQGCVVLLWTLASLLGRGRALRTVFSFQF